MSSLRLGVAAHTETGERLTIFSTRASSKSWAGGDPLLRALSDGSNSRLMGSRWEFDSALAIADAGFKRGVYRHHREGFYQGLGVASYNDTADMLAVYVSLTGAHMPGPRLRACPLEMFLDNVSDKQARFQYVGDEIPLGDLRARIETARADGARASRRFTDLRAECVAKGHEETVATDYGPRCSTCLHCYGWPCPESPSQICQYGDVADYVSQAECRYCKLPSFRGAQ